MSVDKQDINDRVNNYLLNLVEEGQLTPKDAIRQSYFRPHMIELLRTHGYGKEVRDIDLASLELPEEQIV